MSGSEQHADVALVSVDCKVIIGGIVNSNLPEIDLGERHTLLEEPQDVLSRVAEYTEPVAMVQRACNHPAQIILLQKHITDLQSQQFVPPQCDHSTFEQ